MPTPPVLFPDPPPLPSVGDEFSFRYEAVKKIVRYYVTPNDWRDARFFPFSSYQQDRFDSGQVFNTFYGYHRTLEEANDMIAGKRAEQAGVAYHQRICLCQNNLSGWTEMSAQIEARKRNSRKHLNRVWTAIPALHLGPSRFMLEGILITKV